MMILTTKGDAYALLMHLGYLGYDAVSSVVIVPNEEIRRKFVNAVETGSRSALAHMARESRELLRAAYDGDEVYVADVFD